MPPLLDPTRRPGEFIFATLDELPAGVRVLASVMEDGGRCVVLERVVADELGVAYRFVAAWVTLRIESALDRVGLSALVAGALAERAIACNVIAGHHHDHLLVPLDRVEEALETLGSLS